MEDCKFLKRITCLLLLSFASIGHQSIYHFTLFLASLVVNAAFAFRRRFLSSAWIMTVASIYIFLHFVLLFLVQTPPIRDTIHDDIKRLLGLVDVICFGKTECRRPYWTFYLGFMSEMCLMLLMTWCRGVSTYRVEYETEGESSWRQQVYLICPITILLWSLLFPSWMSFVWLVASWFLFSRIAERRHRLIVAPLLIAYASFLLIISYICCLVNFEGTGAKKIGLHSVTGSSAFYSLILKVILTAPFYVMRYFDGGSLDGPDESARREEISMDYSAVQWLAPFICMFTCILYICLRYLFLLQFGDWSSLNVNQWLGNGTVELFQLLWLPIIFIIFIIFVHIRRLEHPLEAAWFSTSLISKLFATYCDTVISVLLSIFAALNISAIGLILLLLSVIIFTATPKSRGTACCTACVLLAILWMLSFLISALSLPFYSYPENCSNTFRFDQNTVEWLGISSRQLWTIIVLLFLLSSRCAFYVDKSVLLAEIERADAEKDVSSLLKYLGKFWMHKFGFETCLTFGLSVACFHHDIMGLFFFVSIALFRIFSHRLRSLFWPYYVQFLLSLVIIEYISALSIPHQFSYCISFFWKTWDVRLKTYLVLPSSVSSSTIIIFDFIYVLLALAQKEVYEREDDHPGGDNIPLSDLFYYNPSAQTSTPALYKDFISVKGDLLAYVHSAVFLYSHWATLVLILICSIESGSFLAFGYMIAVFILLWMDTHLYSDYPFHRFLLYWNVLVYYNLIALSIKLFYFNSACFLRAGLPCWLENVLGLRCGSPFCKEIVVEAVLVFDVICFAALIFQIRIFNSWYFRLVIVDYRADRILGSRGAELLLEMKTREKRRNERRVHSNVNWIKLVVAAEDRVMPASCGPPPSSHEEVKRSGFYHQMCERFFPRWTGTTEIETPRRFSYATQEDEIPIAREQESTMAEKTFEILDSVRLTLHHLLHLINNPEWLFEISKGHAYIAYVLENEKKKIKTILGERLLTADSESKLEELRNEISRHEDFLTPSSPQILTKEALEEWHSIRPAFKLLYCLSHVVMAQSELVCFMLILIVHLSKASFVTLPLPIIVFVWGALCVPGPPKSFWFFSTCYLQFIIIFRMVCQNKTILGIIERIDADNDRPFSLARLLGVHPSVNGTYWDIALLTMLFLHRYKLIRLGMYDSHSHMQHEEPNGRCFAFFRPLLAKKTPCSMDWYPWMVTCDAFCLILISMFYSMIGQGGSGNVVTDVQASRVPRWFAYTLPTVLFFMIFDRWLYMAKRNTVRLIFYFLLVVLLHAAIFYFVPSITGRSVTWNATAIALYLIKSAYLLMNAWHLRNGFPSVLNRDIVTRNYGLARLLILKIYLNIPFLFELRTIMDWTFTSTALTVGDFVRLENYYNEFLAQNCWIHFDHWIDLYFPTRIGRASPMPGKFFKGISAIVALIIVILAPMFLFAFLNSFGTRAPPKYLKFSIAIGGYSTLYEMHATGATLYNISLDGLNNINKELQRRKDDELRRSAYAFLSVFSNVDIFDVLLEPHSLYPWKISSFTKQRLLDQLQRDEKLSFIFNMVVERESGDAQKTHHYTSVSDLLHSEVESLVHMINGSAEERNLTLNIPRYFLVPPSGYLTPATPIVLALNATKLNSTWSYEQGCWRILMRQQPVLFVDRVIPSWMSLAVGSGSMVAMYVAVILVIGKLIRDFVRTPLANTMIEDLPNAENVLRLIQDIYVVREKRQFYLESRLYGKLLFLVRSPETMIRWSRYRVKEKED